METDVFDSAFCSFVHFMQRGSRRKKGEKCSYLVLQKSIYVRHNHQKKNTNVVEEENNDDRVDPERENDIRYNPFHDVNMVNLLKESFHDGQVPNHNPPPEGGGGTQKQTKTTTRSPTE